MSLTARLYDVNARLSANVGKACIIEHVGNQEIHVIHVTDADRRGAADL
jgi:hypothetical protein